ncbi:MAG: S8 family peptidase [Mycobacteriales bacterium]|nr:S8 family peptidase [Mycobacteriales bacterium]
MTRVAPVLAAAALLGPALLPGLLPSATAGPATLSTVIVTLAPTSPAPAAVAALTAPITGPLGGRVTHVYTAALRGVAVTVPTAALGTAVPALRRLPGVTAVERSRPVAVQGTQRPTPSYGLDRIDQRALPLSRTFRYARTGAGVTAYVVDTGVNLGHRDLAGRVASGLDVIDGGRADDCNGHGTHVAGTLAGTSYGVAKRAKVVAVRVLDCEGSGETAGVIAGLDWVVRHHAPGVPAVANLSLGGGASAALDKAVERVIADGVTVALAAGNEGGLLGSLTGAQDACSSSPGRVAAALTVGATDADDARASYSSIGRCLDLFAPGTDIVSAWIGSPTAAATLSGTSMATPHVAGVAALVLERSPKATPAQVGAAVLRGSTPGVVDSPGSGSPSRLVFSGA